MAANMKAYNRTGEQDDESRVAVLVVEDEAAAREASELYLAYCGYDVETAADASSALESAEQQVPNVLVCDWRLGAGGDGVEVARTIQEKFGVPVIFMTAHPMDELREATTDLNVSGFLRKPISLAVLADFVESASAETA